MSIQEDILDFLFDGAVPVEEIFKMNDPSEVHVNGPINRKSLQRKKNAWNEKTSAEKVGVATSVGGAVAGPAAIYMAVKSAKEGKGGMPRDFLRSGGGKKGKQIAAYLDSPKSRKAKIAAGAASAGIVGLQAANWVGDSVNSRQLTRSKNEMIDEAVKKSIHDAVFAGVPAEEIMEMIDKAASVDNAAKLMIGGQRLIGSGLAAGAAGAGWAMGRKKTNVDTEKVVDQTLDERGIKPAPVRKPLTFKPLPNTDYGIMPTVIQSDYKPKKFKKMTPDEAKSAALEVTTKPKSTKKQVQKNDELEWVGEISKVDTEKQHVFGWCSISKVNGEPVVDRQDDYIPVDEMEKSAYDYVLHSRKGGDMHQRDGDAPLHKSDMIESFMVTPEKLEKMGIDPETVPHGWWVGFKINDEKLWDEVKKGEKTYMSVHGRGKRTKVELP
jgi:hypothetical protein